MPSYFFARCLNKLSVSNKYSGKMIPLFLLLMFSLTSCKIATVRSLNEDKEAKKGFVATEYIESIWESEFIPTVREKAVEFTDLIQQIKADEGAAIAAHGNRSGTSAYSFITYGEARVLAVNTESRIGLMTLDVAPFDGQPDASMAIGPVIRGRDTSLRDAVGFIQFNQFTNQTEFAQVSDAMKDHVLNNVISTFDVENLAGQTIQFYGTFMLNDVDDLEIVPVIVEVQAS